MLETSRNERRVTKKDTLRTCMTVAGSIMAMMMRISILGGNNESDYDYKFLMNESVDAFVARKH